MFSGSPRFIAQVFEGSFDRSGEVTLLILHSSAPRFQPRGKKNKRKQSLSEVLFNSVQPFQRKGITNARDKLSHL